MRKKLILLVAVVFLSMTGLAQAAAGELHGAINATYTSQYVWRGFSVFGTQGAFHPGIDLDLYGTGFGLSAVGHMATESGYVNTERWDYTLYYGNRLCESEWYAMNYRLSWVYYNYPRLNSHTEDSIDLQELNGVFSFPNLLGVKGLVPSYVLVKLWPSNSGSPVAGRVDLTTGQPSSGTASGFAHIFMLDYGWAIPAIVPNTAEQVLNLHGEVVYNDGVGPAGQNVDHDWSNAVFGVSTDFPLCKDLIFTPGVYHQVTMDKSVNDEKSLTWAMASLTYKF